MVFSSQLGLRRRGRAGSDRAGNGTTATADNLRWADSNQPDRRGHPSPENRSNYQVTMKVTLPLPRTMLARRLTLLSGLGRSSCPPEPGSVLIADFTSTPHPSRLAEALIHTLWPPVLMPVGALPSPIVSQLLFAK